MLDEQAQAYGGKMAIQLGFHSATESFSVASGTVGPGQGNRPTTPEDTFLFGSGTKPVTAAAVFRLLQDRNISWQEPASTYVNPFLLQSNGTTMEELFGDEVSNATVLDLVRMSAGIPDFETSDSQKPGHDDCDASVLAREYGIFAPYFWLRCAAKSAEHQNLCAPGQCTAYSSTSYEIAGLLLSALQQPLIEWDSLDMRSLAIPNANGSYPSLNFLNSQGKLSDTLTVPGNIDSKEWPHVPIFDQNPSILGWTCGNMVGNTRDVAALFYDLLSPESSTPVVSRAARAEMTRFQTLSKGWNAGKMTYGAGLMETSAHYYFNKHPMPAKDDWAYTAGHDGLTFGFYSENGFLPRAKAGYSIAINHDGLDALLLGINVRCLMVRAVAELAGVSDSGLDCEERKVLV